MIVKVCMITDNGYAIPTAVALTSLIMNKKPETKYRIYIIDVGLDEFHRKKLASFSHPNVQINFIQTIPSRYSQIQAKTHVTTTALIKFDVPFLLQNEAKVLYMDGDTLVQTDLTDLYQKDVYDYYISAVRGMGEEISTQFNKIVGVKRYFNSGVMLMNLNRLRLDNIPQKLLSMEQAHPEWKCMDQDTFNVICRDKILWLSIRYNAMLPLFYGYKYTLEEVNCFYNTHYVNFHALQEDAAIIHFAGESKYRPWNVINGSMSDIWMRYYQASPYKNIDLNRSVFIGK